MSSQAQHQPILNPPSYVEVADQVSSIKPENKQLKPAKGPDAYESPVSEDQEQNKEPKEGSR